VLRLRNRIAGIMLTIVGAIFLAIGVFMMVSAGWTTTTATAGTCVLGSDTIRPGTGTGVHSSTRRSYHDDCQVTWLDAGATRTATLNTERTGVRAGDTFAVKVSGDNVALPSPLWYRLVTLGVGTVAVAGGLILALRRPRRDAGPMGENARAFGRR
jgi:hypothetical protein